MTTEHAGTVLYVVDFGSKLSATVGKLTSELKATAETVIGSRQMLGDPDRTRATVLFQQSIASAEKLDVGHLSLRLKGPEWRHAISRTCSTKLGITTKFG